MSLKGFRPSLGLILPPRPGRWKATPGLAGTACSRFSRAASLASSVRPTGSRSKPVSPSLPEHLPAQRTVRPVTTNCCHRGPRGTPWAALPPPLKQLSECCPPRNKQDGDSPSGSRHSSWKHPHAARLAVYFHWRLWTLSWEGCPPVPARGTRTPRTQAQRPAGREATGTSQSSGAPMPQHTCNP